MSLEEQEKGGRDPRGPWEREREREGQYGNRLLRGDSLMNKDRQLGTDREVRVSKIRMSTH